MAFALIAIAVHQRKPQEYSFGMFQPAQIGPCSVVKADFGAIIGMAAPTYIMQMAGGFDQARCLVIRGREKRQNKFEQLQAKAGCARIFHFCEGAGFNQRIFFAQFF